MLFKYTRHGMSAGLSGTNTIAVKPSGCAGTGLCFMAEEGRKAHCKDLSYLEHGLYVPSTLSSQAKQLFFSW
jgi:hypothetical protein